MHTSWNVKQSFKKECNILFLFIWQYKNGVYGKTNIFKLRFQKKISLTDAGAVLQTLLSFVN